MQLEEIQTGDALLFQGTSFFSRAIQFVTRSPYSHVAMAGWLSAKEREPELWIFEALEKQGVRARPFFRYFQEDVQHGIKVYWYRLFDGRADRQRMLDYYMDRIGRRYVSLAQLVWSFLSVPRWLRHLFGLEIQLDPDRYFCSEIYADAYLYGLGTPAVKLKGVKFDPVATSPAAVAAYPWLINMGPLVNS